jgi:hypothetical protein
MPFSVVTAKVLHEYRVTKRHKKAFNLKIKRSEPIHFERHQ